MKIAVFASGTGTTLQTLIDRQSDYGYEIVLVVTNRACPSLERAERHAIPAVQTKDWEQIDQLLNDYAVDMVVLAGFLAILPQWVCEKWANRIINIHPSLLPKHGGKGMYGIHVQESVLAAGDTVAGCTVHYVSGEIDGGAIIAQATVPVFPDDTAESLSLRVQQQEKILLPQVLGKLVNKQ